MRILLLLVFIYPTYNLAMDNKGQRPTTTSMEIAQPHTNSVHYGESPDLSSALKRHILDKSVSPERPRTPALIFYTPSRDEHAIREQMVLIHGCVFTLEQRVLDILMSAREDKYIMGTSGLNQRLTRHMQEVESLLALLKKSPTAAEYAAHILNTPKDTALAAWKEEGGETLNVDAAFIKEKVKDAQEEIAATRIALHINELQEPVGASCLQRAP